MCIRDREDPVKILVHQLALIHSNDGHEVPLLVHAKAHRPVLDHVAKGIFHLVSVSVLVRTAFDGIKGCLLYTSRCV